jgi:CheY-like chemotaxis protein
MQERSESILLIDDTPANLDIMVEYLAEAGLHAMVARTGDDGIQIARREHPALILLDVMLPGMDGFEVCRCLKAEAQTQDIPVIFMTAVTNVGGGR